MSDGNDPSGARTEEVPELCYIKETRAKSIPQELSANQDLITTFKLLPLYNHYVKQKQENGDSLPPIEPTYFQYISDMPGKNVIRPGNYIRTLLENPEKGYGPIHSFSYSTLRDSFSLRPGPVPGFDSSVLGSEDELYRKGAATAANALNSSSKRSIEQGQADAYHLDPSAASGVASGSPAYSSHGHSHHHHHHHHGHSYHGSKSSTSSPHAERGDRGEDGTREHRHKKKKKKRKHEHDHEHAHHEGEGDSEHRKKKKRKREREEHGDIVVD